MLCTQDSKSVMDVHLLFQISVEALYPCSSWPLHTRHQHRLDSAAVAHFHEILLDYSAISSGF